MVSHFQGGSDLRSANPGAAAGMPGELQAVSAVDASSVDESSAGGSPAGESPDVLIPPEEPLPAVVGDQPIPPETSDSSTIFSRLSPTLLVFQALTGILLMFTYRPTAETAYLDLVELREVSRLGFVRGLHFWGSHAVVIVSWLAVLQVGLLGIRRHRNQWTVVLIVMLVTLALAVTGHILPWDANTFGWMPDLLKPTTMADGSQPLAESSGPVDLITVYALHCLVLPLVVTAVVLGYRRRTQSAPTQSSPTQSSPTQSSPTQSAPTQSAPTQSAPTQSAPTQSAPTQ